MSKKKEQGLFTNLKNLVILDEENYKAEDFTQYSNICKIYTWSDVMKAGEKVLPWAKVTPESIYAFSYTSGTTGTPKGAMISHRNVCYTIKTSTSKIQITPDDIRISYLPMAHTLERILFNTFLHFGGQIGIFSGDVKKITDDLKYLKPTCFASVPRLFNKIYDKIKMKFANAGGCSQALITRGINSKIHNLHNYAQYHHWLYDRLVFNKVREIMGGRVRIMLTGSAPIKSEVLDFLKIAFCCPIIEGYGQTEGNSFEFATVDTDGYSGHLGGPFSHIEFKLVSVPSLSYLVSDTNEKGENSPRGEILVRGPTIIPGYYKLDQKNKETFNPEGWLMSGDVG